MIKVAGTMNGTGTAFYLCLGFVPDEFHLQDFETSNDYELYWNRNMLRSGEFVEGMQVHTGTTYRQITALTKGNGLMPYYGGTTLASGDVGTTTYGEGVYLKPDNRDYRYTTSDSPHGVGDATEETIDTWTLTTAASYAGKFNGAVGNTYIGEGSEIIIDGKLYTIVGFTSDGSDDDDIVLNDDPASGEIQFIGGMYSTRPMVAGEVTKDGIYVANTTVNSNNALIGFEAIKWDW